MSDGAAKLLSLLESGRVREEAQTRYYRRLSGVADEMGKLEIAERLNGLLADEHHHLSRLTARILELGGRPGSGERPAAGDAPDWGDWEADARQREDDEIQWYQAALASGPWDLETERLFQDILDSEFKHREELGGKWMSA